MEAEASAETSTISPAIPCFTSPPPSSVGQGNKGQNQSCRVQSPVRYAGRDEMLVKGLTAPFGMAGSPRPSHRQRGHNLNQRTRDMIMAWFLHQHTCSNKDATWHGPRSAAAQ